MTGGLGQHVDAWGKTTNGCEVHHDHRSHGTWTLCGKTPYAIGTYGDGSKRRLCKAHFNGALRKRVFYANEIVALVGNGQRYELVRTKGRRGYLAKVAS